ncbi:MAG TPA: hypothetical protein VGP61_04485 [Gemmatimonadales bacterium]|nr:hypothetical protein [Gemmatimonadales bacterium]
MGKPTCAGGPCVLHHAAPLTKPAALSDLPSSVLDSAASLTQKASSLPLGGVLGLAVGIALIAAIHYLAPPSLRPPLWIQGLILPFSGLAGVGVERSLHILFGWTVDPKLRRLKLRRDTDLRLEELEARRQAGYFTPEQAHQLAAQICRQGLLGLPRPRGPRGPYKKRQLSAPS